MAKVPFFVFIGSSKMQGNSSLLNAMPSADLARLVGLLSFPSTTPASVPLPGVKMWQAKMPFAASEVRNITDVPTTTSLEVDGAATVATNVGQWVFVATNTTGQGNLRRVTAQAGQALTVSTAWSPTLSANGTVRIITGSRSVGALTLVAAGVADAGGSTSTMIDAARVEADDFWNGNTIRFTSGANNGLEREIIDFIASSDTVVFSPAVTAAVVAADTYDIIQGPKTVTKDTTSPDFTGADVGRWVKFGNGVFRKITEVRSVTTIALDDALSTPLAADSAIFVLNGAAVGAFADSLATFAQGAEFRDLQFYLDVAPVFFTGFDYCNFNQNAPSGPPQTSATTEVNFVPELMWQLRQHFATTIYGFEIGINSAMVSSLYMGTQNRTAYFGWMHDNPDLSFNPQVSSSIMTAVLSGIASARALLVAQGDEMDCKGIFITCAENDTLDYERLQAMGNNFRLIRDTIRTATGNPRAPLVMLGSDPSSILLGSHDSEADRVVANDQLRQLSQDDLASGFVETPQAAFTTAPDQIHYLMPGTIAAAQAMGDSWEIAYNKANDAARLQAELPTLATLRTKVRRRYERSASGNDATTAQIDMFINDSLRELYNTLGDERAWFLRRVEAVNITSALHPGTVTLPRQVKRLMRIESSSRPGYALTWKGIAHTDEGRTQITLHSSITGTLLLHFIALTKDLVADTDVAIVPEEYVELVVVLACKRLTECAGNMAMAQYYGIETARLWQVVKRSCQLHDRMRQGQLEVLGSYDSWVNGMWSGGTGDLVG